MKTIDIGSGAFPRPGCDVYLDCDADKGASRFERKAVVPKGKELVIADLNGRLPFTDKQFSYAYASHVLEHVENLENAIAEIERIAEAGEIRVPTMLQEFLVSKPYHRWLVHKLGDRLLFIEKEPKDHLIFGKYFFVDSLARHRELLRVAPHFQEWTMLWKTRLPITVIRPK